MKYLSVSHTVTRRIIVADDCSIEDAIARFDALTPNQLEDVIFDHDTKVYLSEPAPADNYGMVYVEFNSKDAQRWSWFLSEGDEMFVDNAWKALVYYIGPVLPGLKGVTGFYHSFTYRRKLPAEQVPLDASLVYMADVLTEPA